MGENTEKLIEQLNGENAETRLAALSKLAEGAAPARSGDVNNHIHTWYSFSPYSPSKAVFMARRAGLDTAGIMDHDSVAGLREFRAAGKAAAMPVTCGVELRVSLKGTEFEHKKVNHPDQAGAIYCAIHAIPECGEDAVLRALESISPARGRRNGEMTERLNALIAPSGISLSYEGDVVPLSKKHEGGSVTERHILFALSKKLIEKYGRGQPLIGALESRFSVPVNGKNREWLLDTAGECYEYDLLGALKGEFTEKFYIDADEELLSPGEFTALARECGGIPAYAYLGDVGDSVTGDKKAQEFEDGYLDRLLTFLKAAGFKAVTYMPSRNTRAQLGRVRALCAGLGLFQISGEDINSPRQGFICEAARAPEFQNLNDAAWALIGSEAAAREDVSKAMFSAENEGRFATLEERISFYKGVLSD